MSAGYAATRIQRDLEAGNVDYIAMVYFHPDGEPVTVLKADTIELSNPPIEFWVDRVKRFAPGKIQEITVSHGFGFDTESCQSVGTEGEIIIYTTRGVRYYGKAIIAATDGIVDFQGARTTMCKFQSIDAGGFKAERKAP